MKEEDIRYLKCLAKRYPTVADTATEIINLKSILNLPKGTEHFITDIHGEYEQFQHIIKNASGAIKQKIEEEFGSTISQKEKRTLATLIYYPKPKLTQIIETERYIDDWYAVNLYRLVCICKRTSSKYSRSKVRKALPKEFAYIIEELLNAYGLEGDVQEIPPNGTLMPNTYHYSLGDTRQSIVKRMAESMQKKTAEIWEKRAKNLPFSTLEEAITLASIVEKETSVASERPLIASVFVNRLRKGMRLQSDPTVIYAITDGKYDLKRKLLYKDLRVSHPYNTYTNYGIPPSPICNPGSESIEAVLNPADTDYLYFVANNKGGHSFSNNYRQHTNNVNKLRKKIKAKKDAAKTKNVQEKAKKTEVKPAPDAQKNVYPEIKPKPEIVK